MSDKNKPIKKLMGYLATRDHSVKELRDKLSKNFSSEEIENAIDYANKSGFLIPPKELAEKIAKQLNSKGKGIRYINRYLYNKGLPEVKIDEELELLKARELIKKKFSKSEPNIKVFRFLYSKGYDRNIARQIAHE